MCFPLVSELGFSKYLESVYKRPPPEVGIIGWRNQFSTVPFIISGWKLRITLFFSRLVSFSVIKKSRWRHFYVACKPAIAQCVQISMPLRANSANNRRVHLAFPRLTTGLSSTQNDVILALKSGLLRINEGTIWLPFCPFYFPETECKPEAAFFWAQVCGPADLIRGLCRVG